MCVHVYTCVCVCILMWACVCVCVCILCICVHSVHMCACVPQHMCGSQRNWSVFFPSASSWVLAIKFLSPGLCDKCFSLLGCFIGPRQLLMCPGDPSAVDSWFWGSPQVGAPRCVAAHLSPGWEVGVGRSFQIIFGYHREYLRPAGS